MIPCHIDQQLVAALSDRAACALALARQIDPGCEPATAFILACERLSANPIVLATAIRAATRRERRVGGAHGPLWAASLTADDGSDLDLIAPELDSEELNQATERDVARTLVYCCTQDLAGREGITRRRAQQLRKACLFALARGQMELDLQGGEA